MLLIFRFFLYLLFIDSENSILKEKNDKFLSFNIVNFPNFETSASL